MLKYYFQLIRFPGIFTVFSNILLGYFLVNGLDSSYQSLAFLLSISGMLFAAGMIFNDYFDYNFDTKHNPSRPLPSGKISKKNAIKLGILFLIIANLLSLYVGFQTFLISLIMSSLILGYNFKLKQISSIGIFSLGIIRFLNVILGASIIIFDYEIIFFAIPIGIFVIGLSILAKTETVILNLKTIIINVLFIIVTIVYVLTILFKNIEYYSIVFLLLFSISIIVPYILNKNNLSRASKKIVSSQLLSIILLDAALISLITEPILGIFTVILYIPAYFISQKLYLS